MKLEIINVLHSCPSCYLKREKCSAYEFVNNAS